MRPAHLASLVLLALAVVACRSQQDGPSDQIPTEASASAAGTREGHPVDAIPDDVPLRLTGIGGLIPPHFPAASKEDWQTFFAALPGLGGSLGNYSPLADLERNQAVAEAAGVQVLPLTGFHRDVGAGLEVTYDFSAPAHLGAFTSAVVAFAAAHQPVYLGVGNEVNRIWEDDRDAFEAWFVALPGIIEAIHDASPDTLVFATFQYEFLRGEDGATGRGRVEDWAPVERTAPLLDLVAFTTYPYLGFEDPSDLPEDYYAVALEHVGGRPVGFSEVGWPSEPIAAFAGTAAEGFGGSADEQVRFIQRMESLMAPLDPRFVMWSWAYDTSVISDVFASVGLSSNDGAPKPALSAWVEFVEGRAE